jgi:endonuclease-3
MATPTRRWPLREAVTRLEKHYGAPPRLPVTDPFELILWESCAYLVDDERRAKVFSRLVRKTGADPERIAAFKPGALAELIGPDGGMRPPMRAEKLQRAANLVLDLEGGAAELRTRCLTDAAAARKVLRRFPGIGEPGADRILMIAGSVKTVAPDSNGVRVLLRLGFGKAHPRYDRMYGSVVEATTPELPPESAWWIKAHQLLRHHGKTLCKTNAPHCTECPLAPRCPSSTA